MLYRIRQFINSKPWLGWALAGVLLLVAVSMYFGLRKSAGPYSVERMSERVTIKCIETGDEWEMTRGMMERELRGRGASVDPSEGITNPKTGKRTGFPFNKSDWEATVERI